MPLIDYHDVLHIVSWRSADSLYPRLNEIKVDYARKRFGLFVEALRVSDAGRAEALAIRMAALSPENQERVQTAPDAFEAYASPNGKHHAGFFESAIAFSEHEQDGSDRWEGEFWAPDGSARLVATALKVERSECTRVLGAIPVDFESPTTRGMLRDVSGRDVPMNPDDRAQAVSRIQSGAALLGAVDARITEFVGNYATVIAVRNEPGCRAYSSASSSRMLGRVFLKNVGTEGGTPGAIGSSLIHECVHSILDHCELAEPLLTVPIDYRDRIPSPWSGRPLDLNTYVQACFVWYSLWHFWWRTLGLGRYGEPDGPRLAGLALAGFRGEGILAPLGGARSKISPRVYSALELAQEDAAAII